MYNSLVLRADVDKEHKIKLKDFDATILFLKDSEGTALRHTQNLLINSYEQRIRKIK